MGRDDSIGSVFFCFVLNPVYCPLRRSLTLDFTFWYVTPLAPNASFAPASPVILIGSVTRWFRRYTTRTVIKRAKSLLR
jgi:hypothetical protein